MKSSDPDNRFMAISDLIQGINTKQSINLTENSEIALYDMLFNLLNYSNSQVQNLTTKAIQVLVETNNFKKNSTIKKLSERLFFNINNVKNVGMVVDNSNFEASPESLIEFSTIGLHCLRFGEVRFGNKRGFVDFDFLEVSKG